MVLQARPRTSPCHRAVLRRELSSADFTEISRLKFEPPAELEKLKRTHSDPYLHDLCESDGDNRHLSFSYLDKDNAARWSFIRQQPEYKRLIKNIAHKRAFEEQGYGAVETKEQGSQTNNTGPVSGTVQQEKLKPKSREGSALKRKERQQGESGFPPSRIDSAKSYSSTNSSRHATFPVGKGGRKVSCATLTEITSLDMKSTYSDRRSRAPSSANGRRHNMSSNVTLPGTSGIGQISLQMRDHNNPGLTKTMSMNYSSSALLQNSRILSEELIRASGKKDAMRQAFVRRTERRIKILQKNREQRMKTKSDLERKKRMEEDDDLETVYFRRPEATLLAPSTGSTAHLTAGDKKDFRKERIKERTLLLPENFKTANYLKDFNQEQYKTVNSASYLRSWDTVEL